MLNIAQQYCGYVATHIDSIGVLDVVRYRHGAREEGGSQKGYRDVLSQIAGSGMSESRQKRDRNTSQHVCSVLRQTWLLTMASSKGLLRWTMATLK